MSRAISSKGDHLGLCALTNKLLSNPEICENACFASALMLVEDPEGLSDCWQTLLEVTLHRHEPTNCDI